MSKLSDKFAAAKLSLAERTSVENAHPVPSPSIFVKASGPLHGSVSTMKIDLLKGEVAKLRAAFPQIKINPKEIRPSIWSNRHEDSYKSEEYEQLKKEISASGGNVQAIKVRPVQDDTFKYEIVFGHRRHHACLDLGLEVLSVIDSNLNEEGLFIEMDRENRQRADLRPYEQGLMYRKALDLGLYPSFRALCEATGANQGNGSIALRLARMPEPVLDAFNSRLDIQYRWILPLLSAVEQNEEAVINCASEIISNKKLGSIFSSAAVYEKLTSVKKQSSQAISDRMLLANGKPVAKIRNSKGKYRIEFESFTLSTEHVQKIEEFIEQLLQ
ncbi:MAG: ParB/RepB/Spo0J family partition protein [Clostridia bacterium]